MNERGGWWSMFGWLRRGVLADVPKPVLPDRGLEDLSWPARLVHLAMNHARHPLSLPQVANEASMACEDVEPALAELVAAGFVYTIDHPAGGARTRYALAGRTWA